MIILSIFPDKVQPAHPGGVAPSQPAVWRQNINTTNSDLICRMSSMTGGEPCQPLDCSYNNPLDLSRTELSNPPVRCHQSLLQAGRNFNLSNLQKDWSDDVEGKPWRYSISGITTTSPTVDLLQSEQDQDQDRQSAKLSLSVGEDHRESRGFSDSEELFVFKASRSEIKFLKLWTFSEKSTNLCDLSRYNYSGQAVNDEQPNLLETRGEREDYIELVDQAESESHCGLLLEHEKSILCDPELQMFPLTQSLPKPSLPEIVLQEIPSPSYQLSPKLPDSDSESGRVKFLEDDLMIDLP